MAYVTFAPKDNPESLRTKFCTCVKPKRATGSSVSSMMFWSLMISPICFMWYYYRIRGGIPSVRNSPLCRAWLYQCFIIFMEQNNSKPSGNLPHHSEAFGKVPHDSESFGNI